MRFAVLVLPLAVQGLSFAGAPKKEKEAKDVKTSPTYDKGAFKDDWHTEWKNGDFPSWKETYPKAALKYEDRQSDGEISLLSADPKKKEKAETKVAPKYDKDAFKSDWHTEWKNGDFPSWKETYPKAALPYEDRQSDGKISLLSADPKKKAETKVAPKYDK